MFMLLPALFPAAKVRHVAVSCCSGCLSLYANFSRPSSEAPPCIIHTGSGSLRKWQRSSWMAPEASSDSSTCTSSARSRGAPRAAEERGCRQGACGSSAGDAGYGANNLVNSLLISAQPETTHETPGLGRKRRGPYLAIGATRQVGRERGLGLCIRLNMATIYGRPQ
jgi:hypothetical protein